MRGLHAALQQLLLLLLACRTVCAGNNRLLASSILHHKWSRQLLENAAQANNSQEVGAADVSATDVCAKWGLQPAAPGTKPPRVFDFFLASHELDMMEIRLEELHSVVDRIFVLESRQTFRGKPKPLAFPHVLPRLRAEVIAKVHFTVLDTLEGEDTWEREHHQPDMMVYASLASYGIALDPLDVLIMSDLDEIPKPEFIRAMKQCNIAYPISLNSVFHYYSFNYVNGQSWSLGPTAMQAWQAHSMSPQLLRSNTQWDNETDFDNVTHYSNAAWHCSCCFSHASAFLTKLSSFSHSEFDTPHYQDLDRMLTCLKEGWSLFEEVGAEGAQPEWQRIPASKLDVPQYLRDNAARFAYMLDRSGAAAGLVDVKVQDGTAAKLVPSNRHTHCMHS